MSAARSPIAVYDACVLYPAALRDLLIRLAGAGLCRARWTDQILDEAFENLLAGRPDLDRARLAATRRLMCEAIPECLVKGYEDLVPSLHLPDSADRHVLAAAVRCGAYLIVTDNVRDFPASALEPRGLRAATADQFVLELTETAPELVVKVVQKQAAALKSPPCTVESLLGRLDRQGLKRSAGRLQSMQAEARTTESSRRDAGDPSEGTTPQIPTKLYSR